MKFRTVNLFKTARHRCLETDIVLEFSLKKITLLNIVTLQFIQ